MLRAARILTTADAVCRVSRGASLAMLSVNDHVRVVKALTWIRITCIDRLPGVQMILGHWGELVLFYTERLAVMDRVSELEYPAAHYLRNNLCVRASGMFLPHCLNRAVSVIGTDRLLFSTDFPYQYRAGPDARNFLENCGLDEGATSAFAHRNWTRLTRARIGRMAIARD